MGGEEAVPLLESREDEQVMLPRHKRASFAGSVFNLSCTIVGAGIMSLPTAIKVLGVVPGIILIIVAGVLTEFSIDLLIRFSDESSVFSYADAMESAFGRVGRVLLQISVIVNNVGVMIIYAIIIQDVLSGSNSSRTHHLGVLEGWFGQHWWTGRPFVLIVVALVVIIPSTSLKNIVHTIKNELAKPSEMQAVVKTSVAFCGVIYATTGLFGFLLFGDSTASDLLSNFDTNLGIPYSSLFNDIVRVSYIGHIVLVFPLIFHPLRLNFDGLVFPSAVPLASDNLRFTLITLGLIGLILLGAILVPSIWVAFEFTGATAGALLLFIFPASITLKDRQGIATKRDKIISVSLIIVAVFSDLVAIYSDASSLL